MEVYAVVVTYNRSSLLKKAILAIRNQSLVLSKIIVVNNGSTDETKEWLDSQADLICIHQENVGGSGGFASGVQIAFEKGAEWIWIMDDDVEPEHSCVETLLQYSAFSKCLHPKRIFMDGKDCVWGEYFNLKKCSKFYLDKKEYEQKDIFYINNGCFEGMLIHADIVSKIGYPDRRFFISGDDTIYGFLANQFTNVCCVNKAIIKRNKLSSENSVSPMYLYYTIRNFHIFEEYYRRLTGQSYSFNTKVSYIIKGISNIGLILTAKSNFSHKIKLISGILKGFRDIGLKKINKSY